MISWGGVSTVSGMSHPEGRRGSVRQDTIPVQWNVAEKKFTVELKGAATQEYPGAETVFTFAPPYLYDIRIRRKGSDQPALGFISPSSSAVFVGCEPGEEYEVTTQIVSAETGDPWPGCRPHTQTFKAGIQ